LFRFEQEELLFLSPISLNLVAQYFLFYINVTAEVKIFKRTDQYGSNPSVAVHHHHWQRCFNSLCMMMFVMEQPRATSLLTKGRTGNQHLGLQ
jgi:hypothetical protein